VGLGAAVSCDAERMEQRRAAPVFVRREEDLRFIMGVQGIRDGLVGARGRNGGQRTCQTRWHKVAGTFLGDRRGRLGVAGRARGRLRDRRRLGLWARPR
jgi:hypothetical protein